MSGTNTSTNTTPGANATDPYADCPIWDCTCHPECWKRPEAREYLDPWLTIWNVLFFLMWFVFTFWVYFTAKRANLLRVEKGKDSTTKHTVVKLSLVICVARIFFFLDPRNPTLAVFVKGGFIPFEIRELLLIGT